MCFFRFVLLIIYSFPLKLRCIRDRKHHHPLQQPKRRVPAESRAYGFAAQQDTGYSSCSQIQITSGGVENPSPLVAPAGAYKNNDPSILVNLYSLQRPETSQFTGPAV